MNPPPLPTRESLLEDIEQGSLAEKNYPIDILKKALLQKTDEGDTLYHYALYISKLSSIPQAALTREGLSSIGDHETCLHILARSQLLDQIPQEIFREEDFLIPDKAGWNSFHIAAEWGSLHQIHPKFLKSKNLLVESERGQNSIHMAMRGGHLHTVPKEFFTEEILLTPDAQGQDCLYWGALTGNLPLLPPELLTLKNLTRKTLWKETAFHAGALSGHLHQIPKEFLTAENLLTLNQHAETPLHCASKVATLDKIPKLTYQTIKKISKWFKERYHNQFINSTPLSQWLQTQINNHHQSLIANSLKQDHRALD
jgi:hypothetical protein